MFRQFEPNDSALNQLIDLLNEPDVQAQRKGGEVSGPVMSKIIASLQAHDESEIIPVAYNRGIWASFSDSGKLEAICMVTSATRYICDIGCATAPEARGQGIMGRLVDHVMQVVAKTNSCTVRAYVEPDNSASNRVFERGGFKVAGGRPHPFKFGEKINQYTMDVYKPGHNVQQNRSFSPAFR